jgi:hypothetical protein
MRDEAPAHAGDRADDAMSQRRVPALGADRATRLRRTAGRVLALACLATLHGVPLFAPPVAAHDIPSEVHLHAFVVPEATRLHLLVRIPLVLLLNVDLPKRGAGFLDLARVDDALGPALAAVDQAFHLYENGARLTRADSRARISLPSERAFDSHDRARALIAGPRLPETTDVFWNQGFFDVHLEYPIRSARSAFSLRTEIAPGLGDRIKLTLRFLPPGGGVRAYQLTGGIGHLDLDPRWYQAAWTFIRSGFVHILDGPDHLLFLLCLVIPFRHVSGRLLAVITAFTVAHSITLIAAAYGVVPGGAWFPPVVESLIAASVVYMAIENLLSPNLGRRWIVTGLFGLVHGFGFSFVLQEQLQLAGAHLLLSLLAFNVGIELGQLLVLFIALPALALLFRSGVVSERTGSIILSVLVAHTAWHWLVDRAAALRQVQWPLPAPRSAAAFALWAALSAVAGLLGWVIVAQLPALLRRRVAGQPDEMAKPTGDR